MTADDALELVDTILRLRREVAGLARSVDLRSATFVIESRAVLEELSVRLDRLAALEAFIAPIVRPPGLEPFTLEQCRAWIVGMLARVDEAGLPWPVTALPRALHPSVH